MTESMVERVARAFLAELARQCASPNGDFYHSPIDNTVMLEGDIDQVALARAAIAEAHAPIKAMIERIAQRLESPHAQYVYVASNYRKSDLIRDLYAIADQPAPKGGDEEISGKLTRLGHDHTC